MSNEVFTNNATTTLGSAAGSGATTITVAVGTGALFPAITGSQFFLATLWAAGSTTGVPNEIVKVTARSGDTMTVVRAQEGTTAQSWSVGDTFANYPTAGWMNGLAALTDIQQQNATYFADTGAANAYVVTMAPAPAALTDGLMVSANIAHTNTGGSTLAVNGLGAKAIILSDGTALPAGTLLAGQDATFQYILALDSFQVTSAVSTAKTQANTDNTAKVATTSWVRSAMLNIATAAGFSISLEANGYIALPSWLGSLIVQWGLTGSIPTATNTAVPFPLAFPSGCLSLIGNYTNSSGATPDNGSPYNFFISTSPKTQFFVYNGGSAGSQYSWIAVGF